MDRADLIAQLIKLSLIHLGKVRSYSHFDLALLRDEIRWLEIDGYVVAYADYCWISNIQDVDKAAAGEQTSGPVLYIQNYVSVIPWRTKVLMELLPNHDYIVWRRLKKTGSMKVHAPMGWPTDKEKVNEEVTQAA